MSLNKTHTSDEIAFIFHQKWNKLTGTEYLIDSIECD